MDRKNILIEAKNNLEKQYHKYSKDVGNLDKEELMRMRFIGMELKSFNIKISMISKAFEELWKHINIKASSLEGEMAKEYKQACKIIEKEVPNYINSYRDASSK